MLKHVIPHVQDMIQTEFEECYGAGAVCAVHPVRYTKQLAAAYQRYSAAKLQLEDLLDQYEAQLDHARQRLESGTKRKKALKVRIRKVREVLLRQQVLSWAGYLGCA